MRSIIKALQFLYSLYGFLLFVVCVIIALPATALCLLFGKIKGGNMMYRCYEYLFRGWYLLTGIYHKDIYEDKEDRNKQYIFIANHISYMDIPPFLLAIHQPVRILGKYEMVKVPVFGWIYRIAVVLVDRSSPEARARSVRALKSALKRNISIFIFPEGTLNETGEPLKEFFDGAFRLAIEMQTPIKPLLFIDTVDRLHYKSIFVLTPGPNRVVHLPEIAVDGLTMHDLKTLKQKVHDIMDAGMRKYRDYGTGTGIS
jgi:1-acyl-sn-glycerol-3-phosphate acyltransferase